MMNSTIQQTAVLCFLISLPSCVVPAHAPRSVQLNGSFNKEQESNTSYPNVQITQLRSWDADEASSYFQNPGDYPRNMFKKTPDEDGQFSIQHSYLSTSGFWILPPLGTAGKPGLPAYVFSFADGAKEAYVLAFDDRNPNIRVHDPSTGNQIDPSEARWHITVESLSTPENGSGTPPVTKIELSIQ